ncbi:MAG: di-heme oxidoredictase family protein [Myxococcota bacterium]
MGKGIFVRTWKALPSAEPESGLGPLFNADACTACHFKDGRGGLVNGRSRVPAPLIFLLPAKEDVHDWGQQLQTRSTKGRPEASVKTILHEFEYKYPDERVVKLRRLRHDVVGHASLRVMARIPPTLIGLGLLEAVSARTIAARADPSDKDGDGISGRLSWVNTSDVPRLGRFGWKAQQPTLPLMVATALREDMGISTSRYPDAGCAAEDRGCRTKSRQPEIALNDFELLIAYVRSLAPPASREATESSLRGEALFQSIGCADCHRPTLTTSQTADAAYPKGISRQQIRPYTDMLLHDMGAELADAGRIAGGASKSEWRTAPLWGLGLLKTVNGTTRLLHDGRAHTFEEAILWHGGEAERSRRRFTHLSPLERKDLINFLDRI